METTTTSSLQEFETGKLPGGLNVLTILTIVGCVLGLLSAVFAYSMAKSNYENREQRKAQMESGQAPAWAKSMMPDPAHYDEMVTKSYENRTPIVLISVVALVLCFIGALQMRQRKKQGYLLYVIGELLPFVVIFVFLGTSAVSTTTIITSVVISGFFILLYSLQRKNLIY